METKGIEKKINFNVPGQKFMTKEQFFEKAGKLQISEEKVNVLWKKYIDENMTIIREVFYTKASEREISKEHINRLWEKYLKHIQ